ncbi:MAG: MoaD/ThiS family protein [Pseudomonadales bacterium]|jgi:molybdopterin synthase sulfur carrier subunit|nr:MoaD/ThiS family protein [Pseudomonadales bacterium]MDP6473092.1 MoaD/ThiS family protein [Pseudomonadales bacterium]MDP6826151.1 MoaD/ThiS family protein [Pseudomonadales bacterium]MDP6971939.1 MoaD/ThiS family protein [Pseudomonadales bacterium]
MTTVLFFAQLRERLGCERIDLELDEPLGFDVFMARLANELDVDAIRELQAENIRIAINQTLLEHPVEVVPGDEIAFLPPVTGG